MTFLTRFFRGLLGDKDKDKADTRIQADCPADEILELCKDWAKPYWQPKIGESKPFLRNIFWVHAFLEAAGHKHVVDPNRKVKVRGWEIRHFSNDVGKKFQTIKFEEVAAYEGLWDYIDDREDFEESYRHTLNFARKAHKEGYLGVLTVEI